MDVNIEMMADEVFDNANLEMLQRLLESMPAFQGSSLHDVRVTSVPKNEANGNTYGHRVLLPAITYTWILDFALTAVLDETFFCDSSDQLQGMKAGLAEMGLSLMHGLNTSIVMIGIDASNKDLELEMEVGTPLSCGTK